VKLVTDTVQKSFDKAKEGFQRVVTHLDTPRVYKHSTVSADEMKHREQWKEKVLMAWEQIKGIPPRNAKVQTKQQYDLKVKVVGSCPAPPRIVLLRAIFCLTLLLEGGGTAAGCGEGPEGVRGCSQGMARWRGEGTETNQAVD
jgi:hypothetical protein